MGRYFSKMPRIAKSRKPKPLQGSVGQQRKNTSRGNIDRTTADAASTSRVDSLVSRSPNLDHASRDKVLLSLQEQYGNQYVGHLLNRTHAAEAKADRMISRSEIDKDDDSQVVARQPLAEKGASKAKTNGKSNDSGTGDKGLEADAGFIRLIPKAQRFNEKGQAVGDPVEISDPSQNVNLGDVTNGDRGFIQFVFDMDWSFHGGGVVPENGAARMVTLTPFRVPAKTGPDDDKIKFTKTRPTLLFSEGVGAALDKQPTTSEDTDDLGGSITVAPSITYQLQTATQAQIQGTIQVLFLSVSESFAVQTAVNEVDSISRAYTANLRYKPAQPVPPTPTKQLKSFSMTTEFGVNKREPSPDEFSLLAMWWNGQAGHNPLPNEDARAAVRSGQTQVSVAGHASRTGSREYNLVLAKDRADNVAKFLRDDKLMGHSAQIVSSSAGFDDAAATGEAQTERYVAVSFEAMVDDSPLPDNVTKEPRAATSG